MGLKKFSKALNLCWVCGSCHGRGPTIPHNWREANPNPSPNERCPSYEYFKFRTYTAMDRNSLATLVLKEGYPITEDLKKVFYSCTLCGVCDEICGILNPLKINLAAREDFFEKSGPLQQHKRQLRSLAEYDNPFGVDDKKGEWIDDLGIKNINESKSDTLFYAGCNYSLMPSLLKKTKKAASILQTMDVNFGILGEEEKCCGALLKIIGDTEGHGKLLKENRSLFNNLKIRQIVTMCPTCLNELKLAVEKDDIEVLHITELINRSMGKLKLKKTPREKIKITYHDPCDLGRKGKIYDAPREILKKLPGVELVEMERNRQWAYCCGGGGSAAPVFPEFADYTSDKRIEEAIKTGADILVTACPTCITMLEVAAKKSKLIVVKDLCEFVFDFVQCK
jgi:heterodisulfide reductase subunit D